MKLFLPLVFGLFSTPLFAQGPPLVFEDDFNDGVLDSAWTETFNPIHFWTVYEGNGHWNFEQLSAPFGVSGEKYIIEAPLPNIQAVCTFVSHLAWEDIVGLPAGSGVSKTYAQLLDASGNVVMGYAFEDTNTAGAGSLRISGGGVVKHITGFASQSDAWISLVRDAHGEVSYDVGGQAGSWSGLLGVTTTAITSIRLYVEHDQLCGPCGPHLQPTRFDYVSVNDVVPMGPYLDVQNLVAGGQASFVVSGADPLSIVSLAYSLSGGGPTGTPFGFALLSPPIKIAAQANVDLAGNATFQIPVPPAAAGLSVWLQAYDHGPGSFTQGVQEVIQ